MCVYTLPVKIIYGGSDACVCLVGISLSSSDPRARFNSSVDGHRHRLIGSSDGVAIHYPNVCSRNEDRRISSFLDPMVDFEIFTYVVLLFNAHLLV